jgi:hypothetical protein
VTIDLFLWGTPYGAHETRAAVKPDRGRTDLAVDTPSREPGSGRRGGRPRVLR